MRTLKEIAEQLRNYAVAPRSDLRDIADELDEIAGERK